MLRKALVRGPDLAILLFEFFQVVAQRLVKQLGVHRSQDDAGIDLGFGRVRQDPGEIDDDLRRRVGDKGKIGIDSLQISRQLDLDLPLWNRLLLWFSFSHSHPLW